MILGHVISFAILYVIKSEAQNNAVIQMESGGGGTVTGTILGPSGITGTTINGPGSAVVADTFPPTYPVQPQDNIDAQAIIDGKMSETIIASILPYRKQDRRYAINQQINAKNGGADFIPGKYSPHDSGSTPFKNLCFSLLENEATVLSGYLTKFFDTQEETFITIALVLAKDIEFLKKTYNYYHEDNNFENRRKHQRHPYRNMLWVWCEKNRDPDEDGELHEECVAKDAKALKSEQDDGGWHENRDQIELILMKKSMKYARAVIEEFEKINGGKAIEKIIDDNVHKNDLNHDLAEAYSSLASFIKNKYQYIADKLRTYSNGSDQWGWAVWNMCIAVTAPDEWPKIDEAFKKDHKDDSLSKFIVKQMSSDKVMAEMIAAIVDSDFKPTTFVEKVLHQGPSPPPAPPTVVSS